MDGLVPVVLVVVLIAGLSGFRLYVGHLDRERIREHVEGHGGKVLNIEYIFSPFATGWRGADNARLYDIRYVTHRGRTITATCATNMFGGVWWPREAPPGFHDVGDAIQPSDESAGPDPSSEDIRESTATPTEPIPCLACGAKIPAQASHCPKCGWSYDRKVSMISRTGRK